ncbi:MAG TPA: LPS assembly protein LptD [Vicinamibacteria bacterium]|nr:LPS assembly protein LptD [Vicinamibacteria bacterium]
MRFPWPALALFCILTPGLAAAQAPVPPSPSPTPAPAATPSPPVPPAEAPCDPAKSPDCTTITANKQEKIDASHFRATGFVDLQFGDIRIQTDQIDVYTTLHEDGTESKRIEASGNVVFLRGEERLAGEKLAMDLETGHGTFENAMGYMQPGVFVEARRIERMSADTYKIEGGHFTSCSQPTPRWSFSASSATLQVDDHISAHNVIFRVKAVPALYIPYFMYPIQRDQRSTGFLMPHVGYSSIRGFNMGGGFFWAIGRSFDQTFYGDSYSLYGKGFGHEFRYMLKSPSRGSFRSYFIHRNGGGWEHDLNWNAVQMLPGHARATVYVQDASTFNFNQQFQDNLDRALTRNRRSSISLQKTFFGLTAQALADSTDTIFDSTTENFIRRRHLPSVTLTQSPRKLGKKLGLVLAFDSAAERLQQGDQDRIEDYKRFDVYPRLSRPFSLSFLQVNPEVQYRYTHYDASLGARNKLTGPPLDRQYFEGSLDLRGPTFSRVFSTPGNFYTERYKHVIGPEVNWTYRSKVEDFAAIPRFDYYDVILGTNQLSYALVQRFYAKRPGRSGKLEAYEFFNWRVGQTYYVDIADGQNDFDPNYSSAAFDASGNPSHLSPIQSRMRFRPTTAFTTNFDIEYDVNFHTVKSLGLSTNYSGSRFVTQAAWSRGKRLEPTQTLVNRNTVRGSAAFFVLPRRLTLQSSAAYDLASKELIQSTARLRYDVQCCGFIIETLQSQFRKDRQYRFSIELANIGSIGSFTGDQTTGLGGGYR